jgi:hypothetical protein
MELSNTQAAAINIDHPAELSSHQFTNVFVDAALSYIKPLLKESLAANDDDGDAECRGGVDEDNDTADLKTADDYSTKQTAASPDPHIEDAEGDDFSSAPVYKNDKDEFVCVPQHINFACKSQKEFTSWCLYEYCMLLDIRKIKKVPEAKQKKELPDTAGLMDGEAEEGEEDNEDCGADNLPENPLRQQSNHARSSVYE